MLLELLLLLALLLLISYFLLTSSGDYFERRGIPHRKTTLFSGSILAMWLIEKKTPFEMMIDAYKYHENVPIYGIYDFGVPVRVVRDLELIKMMTVKDFDHFTNRTHAFSDEADGDIFGNTLFSMRDARWRDMRSTLSPAFTGSKLRQMVALINPVGENLITSLKQEASKCDTTDFELNIKEHITRFTNDVIASTAFGLEVNSMQEMDNEFHRMGKKVTKLDLKTGIKFYLYLHWRPIIKWLRLEVFDSKTTQYFSRLVLDAMQYRQQHNIQRADMINLLMEARAMLPAESAKTHHRVWCDKEIAAQCFVFFFAGFDTVSTLICLALHELMENPEVQQKLYQEVKAAKTQLAQQAPSYELLNGLQYMDMVVSETLRKWPPIAIFDRECNKDIHYEANGLHIDLKVGDKVWIPTCGVQRNPKYFENPLQFDPERFSPERKADMQPGTFMPFSAGPRLCIGARFAMLEVKALLFHIMREFRIDVAENTTTPLVLDHKSFQLAPKTGYWLKLVPRNP